MASNNNIKALKQKRGRMKASLTMFNKFVKEFVPGSDDSLRLKLRIDNLKANFTEYHALNDEIEILEPDEQESHGERYIIEDMYLDSLAEAIHKLDMTVENNRIRLQGDEVSVAGQSQDRKRRIKLPEASLPHFSGNYEEWLPFKDAFKSLIHYQADLTNVEKLQYLRSCLKGDAAQKVKIFPITDANYERAWEILEKSYEVRRLIIARHLSLIIKLPQQERESAEGIIKLADETQQHLQSLEALNIVVSEEIIVQLLEEKLHKNTLEKWDEMVNNNEFPKLKDMMDFLYLRASRLQKRNNNEQLRPKSFDYRTKEKQKTKVVFTANVGKSCKLCHKNHPLFKCSKFYNLTPLDRIKAAKDAAVCTRCLLKHDKKECDFTCKKCAKDHNTLLHNDLLEEGSE